MFGLKRVERAFVCRIAQGSGQWVDGERCSNGPRVIGAGGESNVGGDSVGSSHPVGIGDADATGWGEIRDGGHGPREFDRKRRGLTVGPLESQAAAGLLAKEKRLGCPISHVAYTAPTVVPEGPSALGRPLGPEVEKSTWAGRGGRVGQCADSVGSVIE